MSISNPCEVCGTKTDHFISTYDTHKDAPRTVYLCPRHQEAVNIAMDFTIHTLKLREVEG